MSSNNIYYVYAYLRSKDSETAKAGTPYYIGKGKGVRAWEPHLGSQTPLDKSRIVILETGLSDLGALALERRMIRWWGRKDLNTGILFNKTDGGDGAAGMRVSDEARAKISKFQKGRKRSEETKRKMRKPKSESHRANMGKPHSEEAKIKMRKPRSEEAKINMRKPKEKGSCPHCGKVGGVGALKRYHFENCKVLVEKVTILVAVD